MGVTPQISPLSPLCLTGITDAPHKYHGDLLRRITEFSGHISDTKTMDLGVIVMSANTVQEKRSAVSGHPSRQDIKQMLLRRRVRQTRPVYWRKLVEAGVPIHAADAIAKAIAQYDAVRQAPSSDQQTLINEYCRFICRANLWRSQLLVPQLG